MRKGLASRFPVISIIYFPWNSSDPKDFERPLSEDPSLDLLEANFFSMALAQAAGKAAAKNVAKAVAKTATALVMVEPNPGLEMAKNLGKEIHIYKEIYTNQVVYSFYRVMRVYKAIPSECL